ncbi:hypothetical protein [Yoonia sediminilitoris]|uniref:hypothetical protein n=1 Tax=Yoonia sediminilitoris TaxID=1286148 RepID=UPI0010575403|nr:hypothetical protein [Yoonia sediminilitoris]
MALAQDPTTYAKSLNDNPTKPDKIAEPPTKADFCRVLSGCHAAGYETAAALDRSAMRHGFAISGHPKTWTGQIVSLDEWRKLTAWQKHGADGQLWCGVCKSWVHQCDHC